MKQRNLMVLTLSCALLIIIELGVSIIYSEVVSLNWTRRGYILDK